MAVELNHTIVHAQDAAASAQFLADILGLAPPRRFGPFMVVDAANHVSLDFLSTDEPFIVEHYAFLVSEAEFDEIFGRIQARGLDYWADPSARPQRRDQPQRRRPRPLFQGSLRPLSRNHHAAVRLGRRVAHARLLTPSRR